MSVSRLCFLCCFVLLYSRGNTQTYWKTSVKKTWSASDLLCQTNGGRLATFTSAANELSVLQLLGLDNKEIDVWLGLHKTGGQWSWHDGSSLGHNSWNGPEAQPDGKYWDWGQKKKVPSPVTDCASVYTNTWYDETCSQSYTAICKAVTCQTPTFNDATLVNLNPPFSYGEEVTVKCNTGMWLDPAGSAPPVKSMKAKCNIQWQWTFTYTNLYCTLVDCGTRTLTANQVFISTQVVTTYNLAGIKVDCKVGYRTASSKVTRQTTVCQDSAQWTSLQTCEAVDCGARTLTANQVFTSTPVVTTYNTAGIKVDCKVGYWTTSSKVTRQTTVCQDSAQWTSLQTCKIIDCGTRILTANQVFTSMPVVTTYNPAGVKVDCKIGYWTISSQVTRQTTVCQDSAQWTSLQTCKIVNCGSESPAAYSTRTSFSGSLYTNTSTFQCVEGHYFPAGLTEYSTTCLANGTWSYIDKCYAIDCGQFPVVPYASKTSTTGGLYSNTTTYSCTAGHYFSDSSPAKTITCMANGTWSTIGQCYAIDCGPPPSLSYASITSTTGTVYSNTSSYNCDTGYYYSPGAQVQTISCQANGVWSILQQCEAVDCGSESPVAYSTRTSFTGSLFTNTSTFQCIEGHYFPAGLTQYSTTCLDNGTWSYIDKCYAANCGEPLDLMRTTKSVNGTEYTNSTMYTCETGYYFPDSSSFSTVSCLANTSWNYSDHCYVADCGPAPGIKRASLSSQSGTVYTNTTTYQCDVGYYFPDGSQFSTVSCLANTSWSYTDQCYVADCGPASNITKASVIYSKTLYTNHTEYQCEVGYRFPDGTTRSNITCLANVTWSTTEHCYIVDCGPPPNITHATMNITGTKYRQTTQYACEQGYHFPNESLSNTVTCQHDAKWGNVEYCQPRSCGVPPPKQNRAYVRSSTGVTYTQRTVYHCNRGHFFPDSSSTQTSVCLHNGTWSQIELCIPLDCGLPPNITRYDAIAHYLSGTYYTDFLIYQCPEWFSFIDKQLTKKIYCQMDGNWTEPVTCFELPNRTDELITLVCPDPPQLKNVYFEEDYSILNGYTVYGCKVGHEFPDGTAIRSMICLDTIPPRWHGEFIDCQPKQCSSIPVQQSSVCNTASSDAGTVLQCSCRDNSLTLNTGLSVDSVKCSDSGQWSADIGDCNARCPPIPLVDHSIVTTHTNGHWVGSEVQFICEEGYKFVDGTTQTTILCNEDYSWDKIGDCKITRCPILTIPSNGTANTSIADYGTVMNISCNPGWTFTSGHWTIITQCLASSNWTVQIIPQCTEIYCPSLPNVANAKQIGNTSHYGSLVSYNCHQGFGTATQGTMRHETGQVNVSIVCQQDSEWSIKSLSCQVGRCEPVPVITNSCPDNINATDGNIVTYRAKPGYKFAGDSKTLVIQCRNTNWNASLIKTEEVICPPVPNVKYATNNSTHTTYNSVVNITCDTGYSISNTTNRKHFIVQCWDTGQWGIISPVDITYIPQQCSYITCNSLPQINYVSSPTGLSRHYGSSTQYNCLSGHWFSRGVYSQNITCDSQANWVPKISNCSAITCLALPVWNGLLVNTSAMAVGTRLNATCTYDFQQQELVFSDNRKTIVSVCSQVGEWTPEIPQCIVKEIVPFTPSPSEAEKAEYVGLVVALVIGVEMMVILVLDIVSLVIELKSRRLPKIHPKR